jgi:hypothetical protein
MTTLWPHRISSFVPVSLVEVPVLHVLLMLLIPVAEASDKYPKRYEIIDHGATPSATSMTPDSMVKYENLSKPSFYSRNPCYFRPFGSSLDGICARSRDDQGRVCQLVRSQGPNSHRLFSENACFKRVIWLIRLEYSYSKPSPWPAGPP